MKFLPFCIAGDPSNHGPSAQNWKEKVPVIPPGMLVPMYTPYKRYVFSYGSTYSNQIEVLIDYVVHGLKVKAPKTGIVHWPVEWAKEGAKASKDRLKPMAWIRWEKLSFPWDLWMPLPKSSPWKRRGRVCDHLNPCPWIINFIKTAEKFDYFPTYLTFTWCADDSILKAVVRRPRFITQGPCSACGMMILKGGKKWERLRRNTVLHRNCLRSIFKDIPPPRSWWKDWNERGRVWPLKNLLMLLKRWKTSTAVECSPRWPIPQRYTNPLTIQRS